MNLMAGTRAEWAEIYFRALIIFNEVGGTVQRAHSTGKKPLLPVHFKLLAHDS